MLIFMQVNDLIFKELIKRGYSLRGNTRVWDISDSKLWYLTPPQAQAYLNIEDSTKYQGDISDKEMSLLDGHIQEIVGKVLHGSCINIIDIGCGDGRKAIPVIDEVCKKTRLKYCPVDISSFMVKQAINRISKLGKGEVVQFKWNISDFENLENVSALLRDPEFRQNFLLFLGGTVTNFEVHEVMYEVAEAVDQGLDYLLIGLGLRTESVNELTKKLRSEEFDKFFGLVLLEIGFSREEIELGTRYSQEGPRIEWYYTIRKNKTISLGEKSIRFNEGDQILVGTTYRYSKEEFEEAMRLYFFEVTFYMSDDGSRALVLCKK